MALSGAGSSCDDVHGWTTADAFSASGALGFASAAIAGMVFAGAAGGSRVHAGGAPRGTSAGRVRVVALALLGASVAGGVPVCHASGAAAAPAGCLLLVPVLLPCLSVAWGGMVAGPGELLLELLLGMRLGRELFMVVPVVLSWACSLLVVALLHVVNWWQFR